MLVRELSSPVDLLALHASDPERYPYLLQTAARAEHGTAFDMLFRAVGEPQRFTTKVLEELGSVLPCRVSPEPESDVLPFSGGWFAYFGYEFAGAIEPELALPTYDDLPTVLLHRAPAALLVDRSTGRCVAVAEPGAESLLAELVRDAAGQPTLPAAGELATGRFREDLPGRFVQGVNRALEYIAAGDVYQVNLSRQWQVDFAAAVNPTQLYRRLLASNPAPFAGIMQACGQAVVSSSPERLLSVRGNAVATRPIAGTRPRGTQRRRDERLRRELLGNEKERAEHVMLIDLERNDLGRIARPGTVEVDEFMVVESYSHVHHIVSNVRAELAAGVGPVDAIAATFPGGTITGCPKMRCMQIIAELEGGPRGPYTGAFGYINRDGSLDLNILIRTLHVAGATVSFRAGAGIVADSDPLAELNETRAKARGLLQALQVAAA
ncbi:MAG: aminodeoxychorismate synthase component I [Pseudomonadota bacterium]